jgi:TetR/AcrR family transcriptional repressor of nem operon
MSRPREFAEPDVLQKATEVFWKKGYHAASMQDLVDGMGINRASLYATFGDKHQLYIRCLQTYRDALHQAMTTLTVRRRPVRERLSILFRYLVKEAVQDTDRKGCLLANAALERGSEDPDTLREVRLHLDFTESLFRALLDEGQRSGELSTDRPVADLARYLMTLLAGFRMVGKVLPDREALESALSPALDALSTPEPFRA